MTGIKWCCKLYSMKTWITYIAALLMGLATALIFGDSSSALSVISGLSSFMVNLGVCIAIPVLVITFASGTASLRKDRMGGKAISASILWALATTIVFSLAAVILSSLFPVSFPVTSTAGNPQEMLSNHVSYMLSSGYSALYPRNVFLTLASSAYFIVPAVIVSWILGMALKPSSDIIRPAYTTMNSFSEVMYRISRTCTVYGFFLVFASSAYSFLSLYQEKTIQAAPRFAVMLASGAVVLAAAFIPLFFAIFTGFKKNPYKVLYRSLPAAIAGLAAGNSVSILMIEESTARYNLGVQKRISSVAIPVLSIIGKGGSAFVAAAAMISLFQATTGSAPTLSVMLMAAGIAAIVSFASSFAVGTEAIFITVLTLRILGINLYGAENAIVAILPLISGIGIMLDAIIATAGSNIAATFVGTDIDVPYKDIL